MDVSHSKHQTMNDIVYLYVFEHESLKIAHISKGNTGKY